MDEFATSEIEVKSFVDAAEAVRVTKADPPDLIFIDFRLKGTTGDLVALEMPSNIPKYLVTGGGNVQSIYNFDEVFAKPYDPEAIQRLLIRKISDKKDRGL